MQNIITKGDQNMKRTRIATLLISIGLIASMLIGCGNSAKDEVAETSTSEVVNTVEDNEVVEETVEPEKKETPLEETLSKEAEEEIIAEAEESEETKIEEPIAESTAQYTYIDLDKTMYAQQTVNVRDLPDSVGNKIGALNQNDEIIVTGQCVETNWYRFDLNGTVAYVSDKYISENKVEVQQQAETENESESQIAPVAPSSNVSDIEAYPKYVFNDMGDWGFIIWDNSCGTNYDRNMLSGEPKNIFVQRFPGQEVYCNFGFHIKNTTYACWMIYCDPKLPAMNDFLKKYGCSCPSYQAHRYVFNLEWWNERPQ